MTNGNGDVFKQISAGTSEVPVKKKKNTYSIELITQEFIKKYSEEIKDKQFIFKADLPSNRYYLKGCVKAFQEENLNIKEVLFFSTRPFNGIRKRKRRKRRKNKRR